MGIDSIVTLTETLRAYRDELAAKGAGTNQSHALAMERAADEIERLRAHIFEVHTKRSCSVCKELNDRFAPATIDPYRNH